MREPDLHVVPNHITGGWEVRRQNEQASLAHFDTKYAAVRFARAETKGHRCDVIVHDEGINTKGPDWVLDRTDTGAELRIYETDEALPDELASELAKKHGIPGIPQGQIQPKHET